MMQQKTFQKLNTYMAWLLFAIAAIVYALTVEPTASLWDCPEFITCGYKLEIGHPPGAPIFMLVANLFAQFASEPSQVALMINLLSALLSAGCIFFLFLTITHLARRLIIGEGFLKPMPNVQCSKVNAQRFPLKGVRGSQCSIPQAITIEACGVVGALAYTFSDTFWFSAVEAEVYAFSSFLTALMFWLILKWEDEADNPRSDRWIILISYITGLSVGVHLLCLLCLPAMSYVVYFRKARHVTRLGMLKTLMAGFLLVAIILYGLIPGVVRVGGWAELLFTNVLHCPYNTGLICYIVLLTSVLVFLYYKVKRRMPKLCLACLLMILAGYSSYGVIFIRANANTPMCENAPGNIFSLASYLNREQYGESPLLYGPAYCSEMEFEPKGEYMVAKQEEGKAIYRPCADSSMQQYEVIRHSVRYIYKDNMLFPRMYSIHHEKGYEQWMGGVMKKGNLPTTLENLRFFISYQLNFMYWRYFFWNFVGRQNNIQGNGEVEHGNWITGFKWIDDFLLGCDTSKLPSDLKENKGRNVFYALPLLLGLAGLFWQWHKGNEGKRQFLMVLLLFVMTGLAIVVYLNQTPMQPRERDYAYAGSFYAFAVWIGLGVAAISEKLAAAMAVLIGLVVPLQMVSQTWDDHDRSGRYACRDFGANYLESTQRQGHPIIITNGDNDTFPLWYNHEVEGVRTDTRDVNMMYLQTDWYIDQMKRPAYNSPALPISWEHKDYQEGRMEYVPINADSINIGDSVISLKDKKGLYKNELMVLEILSQANWERPVYMSISMGPNELSFLRDHLVLEGLAYRISPEAAGKQVDVERLYENIMHRFRYGGLNRKGIYVDEDTKRMANAHQMIMSVLIDSLLQQRDTARALSVCRKWQQELPSENVPYTEYALSMAHCYYLAGKTDKADEIVCNLTSRSVEWLRWIESISPQRRAGSLRSRYNWMQTMLLSLSLAEKFKRKEIINQYKNQYEHIIKEENH
jgi:hypothetical protein